MTAAMRPGKLLLVVFFSLFISSYAYAQPTASFTFTPTSGCSPLNVTFTNTSTGNNLSYKWDFGNTNSSFLKDPSAIYYLPGFYTVTLTVTDGSGATATHTVTNAIEVYKQPVAAFTSDKAGGCAPATIKFSDITTVGSANLVEWLWDFGDGSTSTLQNPTHTYATSGTFDVTLFVKDKNGCINTKVSKGFIKILPAPTGTFKASDTAKCDPPLTTTFTPNITTSFKGGETYFWDFGDNTTSTSKNPSHTYNNNGSYTVRLTVTDSVGCVRVFTKPKYINVGKELASFKAVPEKACIGAGVYFDNTSSPVMGGSTYSWDFGDGNSSSQKYPTHVYKKTGKYTVKLKVTSAGGCVDEIVKTDYVEVVDKPKADFKASDSLGCSIPFAVKFTNLSPGADVLRWDFGDGQYSTSTSPTHYYAQEGVFDVRLIVKNSNGCTDTLIKPAYIELAKPVVKFEMDKDKGCVPLKVKFTNLSNSKVPFSSYVWDFGDGTGSTNFEGFHTFNTEGTYKVKLTMYAGTSCVDTFVEEVKVGKLPQANFTATPLEGCIREMQVKFTNLTNLGTVKADEFIWDFGDGQTSTEEHPTHQYDTDSGYYTVTLVAINNGCADTLKKINLIHILPPHASYTYKQPRCSPDSVFFEDASVGGDSIRWFFGDGTTTTNRTVSHVFKKPGLYQVRLVAYNIKTGCEDDTIRNILVRAPVDAKFTALDSAGCAPFDVRIFTNPTNVVKYSWDMGDGTKDSVRNPEHTYTKPGLYTITLTVEDDSGCVKVITKKNYISVSGADIKFKVSPEGGCTPFTVTLRDSSTSNVGILARTWDMGDGTILNMTSSPMSYTYKNPPADQNGGYTITLSVLDSNNCKATAAKTVYPSMPKADFTMNPEGSCSSVEYRFIPNTSAAAGLQPLSFDWDFGDNTTSKAQNPLKKYTTKGQYDVTLTMTDKNGCKSTITKTIEHKFKYPEAKFSAAPTDTSCPPLLVYFKDLSTKGYFDIVSWEWDFGDGKTSILRNPSHIYILPGKYSVKLKITDRNGCVDSIVEPANIKVRGPIGSYTVSNVKGCVPFTVTYKVTSQTANRFIFDFGDGTVIQGTDKEMSHTYTYAGNFIPHIFIGDDSCIYDLPPIDTVQVAPLPLPNFGFNGACFGYTTEFVDMTNPVKGTVVGWKWDFDKNYTVIGDPNVANPQVIYDTPGYYKIILYATTSFGCTDSISKTIKIGGLKAKFSTTDDHGCVGKAVYFTDKTFADTAIYSWQWDFGDGAFSPLPNPSHTYYTKGLYDVRLVVTDYKGCADTLYSNEFLIGDTMPPIGPKIHRVTVEGDNVIKLEFSKYKDIDLEGYVIYRKSAGGTFMPIDTLFNVNDTVYLDNKGLNAKTTVYCYSVRTLNVCGYVSAMSSEHCTVELRTTAGVNQVTLDWNHYLGWQDVQFYTVYREDVNTKGKWDELATVAGSMNTYVDEEIICYRTHNYRVRASKAQSPPYDVWSYSDTAAATPIYIPNVQPAKVVRATVVDDDYIHIEWAPPPPKTNVSEYVVERSEDGFYYSELDSPFKASELSTDDKRVRVDDVSYTYRIWLLDSCGDRSPYSNIGKTILLQVDTTPDLRPRLVWTQYRQWEEGVHHYDVELQQQNGQFVKIGEAGPKDTQFVDGQTDPNSLPKYCYRVIAYRNTPDLALTSTSNEDCTPVRSVIWVPNVFTPNGDHVNDSFEVYGMYIREFNIKIFDRWGTKVYESDELYEKWDGRHKNHAPVQDSYRYMITAKGADGHNRYLSGWVNVLP